MSIMGKEGAGRVNEEGAMVGIDFPVFVAGNRITYLYTRKEVSASSILLNTALMLQL